MVLQHSRYSDQQASFKLLIIGEIGVGKTRLTSKLLNTLIGLGLDDKITVIDLAPSYKGIGLPLDIKSSRIKLLKPPRVYAPRLMGRNCDEVWYYARCNANAIKPLLIQYINDPTPILVINDLTIYLHAGDPAILYEAIDRAKLFIGNAYYGVKLRDECGLWERERRLVEELCSKVDLVCRL